MSVDYFLWLDQIQPDCRDRVGSKAFYLALLKQGGYPVVPGLVASSDLFQTFLNQIEWTDPTFADLPASSLYVDVDNARQLQGAAQHIRQAIVSTPIPDDWLTPIKQAIDDWQTSQQTDAVILRPSFSLASGLDSSLSYHTRGLLDARVCWANPDSIALGLKQVWAELFRARSLLYWQRLGIQPQQVQLAVLIQPMAAAIAAGNASLQGDGLTVQAVWGLGYSMAQGVMPDHYRVGADGTVHVDRISRKNVAFVIGADQPTQNSLQVGTIEPEDCLQMRPLQPEQQSQPVLTPLQIERLADLSEQVTQLLDMQVELEWMLCSPAIAEALEPDFYITQVIPRSTRTLKQGAIVAADDSTPLAGTASGPNKLHPDLLSGIAAAPGRAIAAVWVMSATATWDEMPSGCILVAPMILPDWVSRIGQIAAIVTEQGGTTSHGAILARELGIPAVVGIADAMQILQAGERVLVDGDHGEVRRIGQSELSADSAGLEALAEANLGDRSPDTAAADEFLLAMPATVTRLMVSLSRVESISQTQGMAIDGIGLLRSELLWLQSLENRSPDDWLQQDRQGLVDRLTQQIQQFADAMRHRPVFYRSLDARAHEFPSLAGSYSEPNSMLGLRGTSRYQISPAWFDVELTALRQVQQAGYNNLRLILPFVRTVEEFSFCRDRVERAGLRQPGFELWIMAEVPSVLLLLPEYIAAGVQGLAIGCNDLTQLLLGVDRDHPQMAMQFNMTHPAVMGAIQQIVQTSRAAGVPCTVCGHLPRQLDVIDRLVAWGVTGISVEPGSVTWMNQAIDRAERKLILERTTQQIVTDATNLPEIH